jgi:CobQ/CobB/MinD/ParA nucleotide binding domain
VSHPPVVIAASFKGGSGRTTTMANVAFRLALNTFNRVCMIDLDLAAPTLGSVLELDGYEAGTKPGRGIHSFLPNPETGNKPREVGALLEDADLLVDVRRNCGSPGVRQALESLGDDPWFRVLLGEAQWREVANPESLSKPINSILETLSTRVPYVFVDVRAGTDSPLFALTHYHRPRERKWAVFYRWTPQHVRGTAHLIDQLIKNNVPRDLIHTVRVARGTLAEPLDGTAADNALASWMAGQDALTQEYAEDLGLLAFPRTDIPRSEILFWRDGIIAAEALPGLGQASRTLTDAYRQLAVDLFGDDVAL